MKKAILLLSISGLPLLALAQGKAAATSFSGAVHYTIISQSDLSAITCYYNPHFLKQVDTSANYHSKAGFTEVLWNLAERQQYIINHAQKVVYTHSYELVSSLSPDSLRPMNQTIHGLSVSQYRKEEQRPVEFLGRPDTTISANVYLLSNQMQLAVPIGKGGQKFGTIGAIKDFIPLEIENTSFMTSAKDKRFTTSIKATRIKSYAIPDLFFKLPTGYTLKPYDEEEVKHYVGQAIRQEIDFLQLAKEAMQKGQ